MKEFYRSGRWFWGDGEKIVLPMKNRYPPMQRRGWGGKSPPPYEWTTSPRKGKDGFKCGISPYLRHDTPRKGKDGGKEFLSHVMPGKGRDGGANVRFAHI